MPIPISLIKQKIVEIMLFSDKIILTFSYAVILPLHHDNHPNYEIHRISIISSFYKL